MAELALYVHFPWCVRKCPYCDFNSHEFGGDLPEQEYITALITDLDRDMRQFDITPGQRLTSIFMGGGTPSLFSPEALAQLMSALHNRFHIDDTTEVTMEANPGTTDANNFKGYRKVGINRISLGVQSFGKNQLSALGRIHTADQASEAYGTARDAGFENINLDLMHGLPEQGLNQALHDLDTAIRLKPEHISWYQLTIEPNTVYYNQPPQLPDDDTLWQIFVEGGQRLEAAGYQRYEISAFSQANRQAAHNLNYWRFGDYLGIGAGAHGKLTTRNSEKLEITRTSKTRRPADYLREQKSKTQLVSEQERPLEFLMNTLRLIDGVSLESFTATTGLEETYLKSFISAATTKGLLEAKERLIKPTDLGTQYLNDLLLMADDHTSGF